MRVGIVSRLQLEGGRTTHGGCTEGRWVSPAGRAMGLPLRTDIPSPVISLLLASILDLEPGEEQRSACAPGATSCVSIVSTQASRGISASNTTSSHSASRKGLVLEVGSSTEQTVGRPRPEV